MSGAQLLAIIAVPLTTLGLWWLLNRTRFGESVRASVSNPDLARLTGINPKTVSTGVWTLAGFLSALAVILIATGSTSTDLVAIGPDTLLRGMVAAMIGGMVSFPVAFGASIAIGLLEQVLIFNFPAQTGLLQFILFVVVVLLVGRVSRKAEPDTAGFQFAPRIRAVPERLKQIWWVRRLPQLGALLALLAAVALPLLLRESSQQATYAEILAFALCATSVTVLTGWAGQLSLGQMGFAGIGALSAAAFVRGVSVDIGWGSVRVLKGSLPPIPFGFALLAGAAVACLLAAAVGVGALRVRGLLLAVSTLAFAIAAQDYIFPLNFFSLGQETVQLPRGNIGPFNVNINNRGYYYGTLIVLAVVLVLLGRLRRSGIGRTIIGVRENENAAAALTVSPIKAKLTAYSVSGFIAGLGGAILGGLAVTIGYTESFFTVDDSLALVAMAVIGGLGGRAGAVIGALWVIGLPAFWPNNNLVPLLTSSIGLLIILLYIPGGFTQIGYWFRDEALRFIEKRQPAVAVKASTEPPTSLTATVPVGQRRTNDDGSVLRTSGLTVAFSGLLAVDDVNLRAGPGEVVGLIGSNGAGKSTLLNAVGGFVPAGGRVELLGHDVSRFKAHKRAASGPGSKLSGRHPLPRTLRPRSRRVGPRGPSHDIILGNTAVPAPLHPTRAPEGDRCRRADRLPGARSLCRPLRGRALDGHATHRRTGRTPGRQPVGHLPGRTHGRRGPTRGGGLRTADQTRPGRTRCHPGHRRARSAHDPVHQRSRLLPRGGCGDRRGNADRGPVQSTRDRLVPGHRRAGNRTQQRRPGVVTPFQHRVYRQFAASSHCGNPSGIR